MPRLAALVFLGCLFTPDWDRPLWSGPAEAGGRPAIRIDGFGPLDIPADPALSRTIQQSVSQALVRRRFRLTGPDGKPEASAWIAGFYGRAKRGNLALFGQIYRTSDGALIDAYNEELELSDLEDLEIPDEDLRVPDADVIRQFSERISARLLSNPFLRERPQNIERYVTGSRVSRLVRVDAGQDRVRRQSEEVFRLLEDQEVVSASLARTRLREAPAAVYVITSRQIEERGYRTLVDALHDVPGFDIVHVYGIFPELIHQRGLVGNNQRTLLYVDGILDNNLTEAAILAGSIRFPLHNVDRIEIVSGPASAVYGANAFNGVINIITKDGAKDPGGQLGVTYGSYESDFRRPGASARIAARGHGGSGAQQLSYSASAYYYKTQGPDFGGIRRLEKPATTSEAALARRNDAAYGIESELCSGQCQADGNSRGYFWSPRYNVSYEDTYNIVAALRAGGFRFETIHWQYLQGEGTFANGTQQIDVKERGWETGNWDTRNTARAAGIALGVASPKGFTGSYWNFRNTSAALGYTFDLTTKLKSDTQVIVRHTEVLSSSQEEEPLQPGPYAYLRPGDTKRYEDYDRPDYAYELKERFSWTLGAHLVSAGAEWIQTSIPLGYGATDRIVFANYAAYVEDSIRAGESASFTLGYRYDRNTDYGESQTPRASAVFSPKRDLTIKLLAAGGFRAPTGWELFNATAQRVTNKDLKPERQRSGEVGVSWRISRPFYVAGQFYYNDISDLLLEVETAQPNPNTPGTYYNQNQNVGRAVIKGAEFQGDAQISRKWSAFVHYTYSDGEYIELPDPVSLSGSPSTRGRRGDDPFTDGLVAAYRTVKAADPLLVDLLESSSGHEFSPYEGPMPNVARHKGGLGAVFRPLGGLSLHARFHYVSERRTIATNPEPTIPGYVFWSGNIRFEPSTWRGLVLELMVRNLTNDLYFDPGLRTATGAYFPTRHPLEKRNAWLSVSYRW